MQTVACVVTTTDCWFARGKGFIGMTGIGLTQTALRGSQLPLRVAGSLDHTPSTSLRTSWTTSTRATRLQPTCGQQKLTIFSVFGQEREVYSDDENCNEDVAFQAVGDLDTNGCECQLLSHQRCVCHTLQLVDTGDTDQAESDGVYKKLPRAAFANCQSLWNKSSKSVLL